MAYYTSAKQGVHGNKHDRKRDTKTHGVHHQGASHSPVAATTRKKSNFGKKKGR